MRKGFFLAILFSWLLAFPLLAANQTFTGTTTLTKDTYYQFDIITLDNATFVTNGFRLTIEGKKGIVLKGTPRIVDYASPQASGRSGGLVLLKTPDLSGTILVIDNRGEIGAPGAAGASGAKGSQGGQGTQRDWNPWNGCIGGSNGGQGGTGGDGGPGAPGGLGGNGGSIALDIKKGCLNGHVARLELHTDGGSGGRGGVGGSAGAGGDGGLGAPGTAVCGGTDRGPSGPSGRPGVTGPSGAVGNAGVVIDLNLTCSTQVHTMSPTVP